MDKLPNELKDMIYCMTDFNTCYLNNNGWGMKHFINETAKEMKISSNGFMNGINTFITSKQYYEEVLHCMKIIEKSNLKSYINHNVKKNDCVSSYTLKKRAKYLNIDTKEFGYINHGSMMLALIFSGFRMEKDIDRFLLLDISYKKVIVKNNTYNIFYKMMKDEEVREENAIEYLHGGHNQTKGYYTVKVEKFGKKTFNSLERARKYRDTALEINRLKDILWQI